MSLKASPTGSSGSRGVALKSNNSGSFALLSIIVVAAVLVSFNTFLKPSPVNQTETPRWQVINPPSDVTTMVQMGDTVWIGGKSGVQGIKWEGNELVDFPCGVKLSYVRHMLLHGGDLYIGHDGGLTVFNGETCTTYSEEDGLVESRVNWIMETRDGRLWIGTWSGAYYSTGDRWASLTIDDGLIDNDVHTMLEDRDGGLWFGSYQAPRGGISVKTGDTWQYFSTENGLPHNNVNNLYLDVDGTVWAATGLLDRGGAVQFRKDSDRWGIARVLDVDDGLPLGKIRSIYRDPDGMLWIGSESDGLAMIIDDEVQVLTVDDGLSNNEVKVMWNDASGNMWLGTRDGVTLLTTSDLDELTK